LFLSSKIGPLTRCSWFSEWRPFHNLFIEGKPAILPNVKPFYYLCVLGFVRSANIFHTLPNELSDPDFYRVNTDLSIMAKMLTNPEVNGCWNALVATYGPTETARRIYELVVE